MNWIAVVIDLVLVGIVALCAWRGWKQGIIVGALSIAGIVACMCVGSIMATAYAEEFSAVPKSVGAGLVDSVSTKLLTADYSNVVEGEDDDLVIRLTDQQKTDVFSVSYATCRQLGLADSISQKIADEAAAQTSTVNQQLSATLSNLIWLQVTRFLIFAIVFLLTVIILAALKNTLDLFLSLPGLELVNRILGLILGAAKGVIYILLLAMAMRYVGIVLSPEITERTLLAKVLMENNFVAAMLGL